MTCARIGSVRAAIDPRVGVSRIRSHIYLVHAVHCGGGTRERTMNGTIDETIERLEQLYTTLTGTPPPAPNGQRTPFPPESDPLRHVQEQLGRVVAAAERLVPRSAASAATWIPNATVWTEEADLVLAVDVPGVSRENVEVRVEPRALTVTGRRHAPWSQYPRSIAGCDAPLGTFSRTFAIATHAAADRVSARLDDGVLTIRIHSTTQAPPSQISITQ